MKSARSRSKRNPRAIGAGIALALLALLGGKEIMAVGLSDQAVQARIGTAAYWMRPGNSRGTALAADNMLEAGERDSAVQLARRALSDAPLDVTAIRVLGEAFNRNRPGSGDRLMVLAGRLGWRDRPTQLWLVERAVRTGDFEIAMTRSEALVRQMRQPDLAYAFFRLIAQNPRGRELLVRSLQQQPFWRTDFFQKIDAQNSDADVSVLLALLQRLSEAPAPPTIVEGRATIDALISRGRAAAAYDLYRRITGRGSDHRLLTNGDFEAEGISYGPGGTGTLFDWRLYVLDEASADLESLSEGGRALLVTSDGMNPHRLAERTVVLPPGRYRLSYRIRADEEAGLSAVRIGLRCGNRQGELLDMTPPRLTPGAWHARRHVFTVPAGCPMQVLEVLPGPSTGRETQTLFDDFAIAREG